ncbi:MAG: CCA tRNA nucleotidyltransferase [Ruminococcaceae bacterium]|nr:CCA tRNA nucleotidyltransferase [Oscillospiraceae bacterium]
MKLLSKQAESIIGSLYDSGYEAYAVGGCTRDMIMGRESQDTDITTSATPEEIKKVFRSLHTIDTGIRHGTVTVLMDGIPFEITTYRTEKGYSDGRHPDKVTFTRSLTEDLKRRDFTVNSIAYSPRDGFVDPFGGREDIERGLLRCVGNPKERFTEDSLRILRGLRFCSVLGFSIEKNTAEAMRECKELLSIVSKERIFSELTKLICGKNVRDVLVSYSDILEVILPEIKGMKGFDQHNFHHIYDVLEHTAAVTESIPPVPHLRYAALFHDCGKPDCFSTDENGVGHFYSHPSASAKKAEEALLRLKSDTKTKEAVIKLVKTHDTPIEESERIIKKRLRSMGEELFFDLIRLKRADTKGLAPEFHDREIHFDKLEKMAKEIIKNEECFSLRDLKIDGNDLIREGFRGKEIGSALSAALEAVIDGRVKNEKEALLSFCSGNRQ